MWKGHPINSNLFSIIIPTLNEEAHIEKLIRSIYTQGYRPIEVIVVDDGSKDNTKKIVSSVAQELNASDFRIILSDADSSHHTKGPSVARNLGIQISLGEFIYIADADFLFIQNDFLTLLHSHLLAKPIAAFMSRVIVDNWLEKNQLIDNGHPPYHGTSYAFRRSVLLDVKFDPRLGVGEDVNLVSELRQKYDLEDCAYNDVEVALHYPHSLLEYGSQKFWQGKDMLSTVNKKKKGPVILNLFIRIMPVILLFCTVIFVFISPFSALLSLGVYASFVLLLFIKSKNKSLDRLAYLFLRFSFGSLWFTLGLLKGLLTRATGTYSPGREN